MMNEMNKYLEDWFYDDMGNCVFKGKPRDIEFTVCDIRGWGFLERLGEKEAIAVQEFIGQFIADAPATIKALQAENERLKRIIDPHINDDGNFDSQSFDWKCLSWEDEIERLKKLVEALKGG